MVSNRFYVLMVATLLVISCAKNGEVCTAQAPAPGLSVFYTGPKTGDFSIQGFDYFGSISSVNGANFSIQWEAFSGPRNQSSNEFVTQGSCTPSHKGKRVRYTGPQGPSEFYFPNAGTVYEGSVQAAFPDNRFQVLWDATSDTSLTSGDQLKF